MQVIGGASITSKQPRITLTNDVAHAAQGCYFYVGNRQIVDFAMGLHGALAGHAPIWWQRAIYDATLNCAPSIPVMQERQAAMLLQAFYPNCDAVRWMADGSNPCEAAVRLARACTGRDAIAFCGYHGYGTSFPHNPDANDLGVDERRGIPQEMWRLTRQFEWGNKTAIYKLDREIAAIIVEVPPVDDDAKKFLQICKKEADLLGALFIIDDVVTGFRVAPGGAAERYSIEADLYCLGKALGNGFNVSALVGKSEVMDLFTQGVHYSATFNGYGMAVSAALATLKWITENRGTIYPTLYARGEMLKDGMNRVFADAGLSVRMVGNPTRPILKGYLFDTINRIDLPGDCNWLRGWRKRMYARGFYVMAAPWFVTMAHTEDVIAATVDACRAVCGEMT